MVNLRQLIVDHFRQDTSESPSWFRMTYHGIFWVFFLAILIVADEALLHGVKNWSFELINLFFYAVIVYYNLLYLVPNYLSKKRFLHYAGLLVAVTLIITCLR
ncbi:MAG: histidine kinase, partial [Bacteroidota bacterium]